MALRHSPEANAKHKIVGRILGDLRRKRGYPQADFAVMLGERPQSWVASVDTGRIPLTIPQIEVWLRLVDTSLSSFIKVYESVVKKAERTDLKL